MQDRKTEAAFPLNSCRHTKALVCVQWDPHLTPVVPQVSVLDESKLVRISIHVKCEQRWVESSTLRIHESFGQKIED